MKYLIFTFILAALILMSSPLSASYLNSVNEVIAGSATGIGAKQMAMGGAGMMAIDGTSLYYNPANLTRVPRLEFMLGLSYQKYKSDMETRALSSSTGYDVKDSHANTRISSAIMTIPYPTYRGSMVFGFGVARTADFDGVSNFYFEEDNDGVITATSEEVGETGGINQWSFGMGIDLSPRVAFGGSVSLYHGKHKFNLQSPLYSAASLVSSYEQFLEYRYIGYGAKVGLAMQLSPHLGLGMTIESPIYYSIDQDGSEVVDGDISFYPTFEYDLKKPFVFSAGAIGRFDYLTLMADVDYTDWSQMSYSESFAMEMLNDELEDAYGETVRFRVGAEYVIPNIDLAIRGGFFNDPLPYKETISYNPDTRYGYSFGFGFLVDEVMMIDFAYVHGSFSDGFVLESGDFVSSINLNEDVTTDRLFMTASYRF
ncbi:MAG: outer membrane protein transport protein [Candidatus Zixiibacteriota bacterium]